MSLRFPKIVAGWVALCVIPALLCAQTPLDGGPGTAARATLAPRIGQVNDTAVAAAAQSRPPDLLQAGADRNQNRSRLADLVQRAHDALVFHRLTTRPAFAGLFALVVLLTTTAASGGSFLATLGLFAGLGLLGFILYKARRVLAFFFEGNHFIYTLMGIYIVFTAGMIANGVACLAFLSGPTAANVYGAMIVAFFAACVIKAGFMALIRNPNATMPVLFVDLAFTTLGIILGSTVKHPAFTSLIPPPSLPAAPAPVTPLAPTPASPAGVPPVSIHVSPATAAFLASVFTLANAPYIALTVLLVAAVFSLFILKNARAFIFLFAAAVILFFIIVIVTALTAPATAALVPTLTHLALAAVPAATAAILPAAVRHAPDLHISAAGIPMALKAIPLAAIILAPKAMLPPLKLHAAIPPETLLEQAA